MRSNWTGKVELSLLSLPVRLGSATTDGGLVLHQVRASDGSPVKYVRVAEADGQEVPWPEVAKGYDAPDGSLVILDDEDFKTAYGEKNRVARIALFVPESQVPRTASRKFHLVQPDKGGEKAYALLASVLAKTGKVAVLTFAMRQRESIAVLRSQDGYLILEELEYHADVLMPDFAAPRQDFTEAEEDLAMDLIGRMSGDFDYPSYTDKSAEALGAVIAQRIEHGQVISPPAKPAGPSGPEQALDLMAALSAAVKDKTPPARKRTPTRRKSA
jgi:DNA end-binding protein Ku